MICYNQGKFLLPLILFFRTLFATLLPGQMAQVDKTQKTDEISLEILRNENKPKKTSLRSFPQMALD